ncbi:uncharacterized protein LOC117289934 [Asterias rubens]|uniref:uncharacterized protein LOC117289934 n=1 Tax=Asterias rubens TaxID=7604 RepID=UPI001455599B|nr:uncharacterized protein LOC117289934 [Asterias rubens]
MPDEVVDGVMPNGACETIPQSQPQEVLPTPTLKKHPKKHNQPKKKTGKKKGPGNKEVDLLGMNREVVSLTKEKMLLKRQSLEYQKETIEVLREINATLQRAFPSSSAVALFNSMSEQ